MNTPPLYMLPVKGIEKKTFPVWRSLICIQSILYIYAAVIVLYLGGMPGAHD